MGKAIFSGHTHWKEFSNPCRSTISGGERIDGCLAFLVMLFLVFSLLTILEFQVRAKKVESGKRTWIEWLERFYYAIQPEAKYRSAAAYYAMVADRIAALAQVREWLIESAKGGALKGFGVSAADAEGITIGGARQTWEDFAIRQQGLSFRIFNTLLADDQGAWGLSTLRRAELAIGARQFVLRYFGASMLEKSKSLRDMMDRLKAVADRLPATRAALGRLEPQGSGE